MESVSFVSVLGIIVPVVAIFASYFIGVAVGKKNEVRKEWNTLVEPVLVIFESQRSSNSKGLSSKYDAKNYDFPYERINAIKRRMAGKQLSVFEEKYSTYHKIRTATDRGEKKDRNEFVAAIDGLLPLLKLKK